MWKLKSYQNKNQTQNIRLMIKSQEIELLDIITGNSIHRISKGIQQKNLATSINKMLIWAKNYYQDNTLYLILS